MIDAADIARRYGGYLIAGSILLTTFCFYSLNSQYLFMYSLASIAVSIVAVALFMKLDKKPRHYPLVVVITTGLLSVIAMLHYFE